MKKIRQKMNIGTPFEIFSIIYIDKDHSKSNVINEKNLITFSATSREKTRHIEHFNIIPPSSEFKGSKLKMDRQSESRENGNKKF